MNRLNQILIAVLALQVGLAVALRLHNHEPGIPAETNVVAGFDPATATKVAIYDKRERGAAEATAPAIVLTKAGESWTLTSAFDYPADASKVSEMLSKFSGLRARGTVASGVGRERQLEVADDLYDRKVVVTTAKGEQTFFIGASAGARRFAFRIGGSDGIYGTDLSTGSVGATASAWIDTSYAKVAKDQIEKVTISGPGKEIVLDKASGTWVPTVNGAPVVPAAGDVLATELMDRVANQFSDLRMAAPGDPKRAPDANATTVTLTLKAPAPAALPDGGAAPATAAVSVPDEVFVISAEGDKQYWVQHQGNARAALVTKGTLDTVMSLELAKLTKKPPPPAQPGDGPAVPGGPGGMGLQRPAGMPDDMPMPPDMPPGMAPQ